MLRFAWQNLLSRPLRTTLAALGLTVAIAGMVGLFSIAGGIDRLVSATFSQIPGLLVQQRGAPIPLFSRLPAAWRQDLESIPGVARVTPEIVSRVNIIEDKPIISPPRFLLGVDIPSRLALEHGVYNRQVDKGGRFLNKADEGTKNVLISRPVAEEFHKEVGDTLNVNGYDLTIVGIYHTGSMLLDVSILMDINVVRELARIEPGTVSSFYVEQSGDVTDPMLVKAIEDKLRDKDASLWQPSILQSALLEALMPGASQAKPEEASAGKKIAEGNGGKSIDNQSRKGTEKPSPVEVRTQQDWADKFEDFSADLNLFLTIMTAVGLLIAIFSIINTMLMSVTERMIEFGILRANGWSQRDVLALISFESGLLGLAGGILGAIVGWIAVQGINAWQPDRVHLYAGPGLLSFSIAFSTVLGVAGGVYPAWRAARKSPMDAIRRL